MRIKQLLLGLMLIIGVTATAQTAEDVMLLKNPTTNKWGYANKKQGKNSPIRGLRKTAINMLGKTGQNILSSSYVNEIDWAIPAQYDAAATDFEENLAAVEVGGKVGFIDLHNRFIIEPTFAPMKNLEGFSQGLAAVKIGDKYGYIDKRGQVVIKPQFELAKNFRDNMLATVKKEGKFGAIDITGQLVVECKYALEEAMTTVPISNKEYREAAKAAKTKKNNDGYSQVTDALEAVSREVNKRINDSTWVQKLTYETVYDNNRKGINDNYGRIIIPPYYHDIRYEAANHVYVTKMEFRENDIRYGVFNDRGKLLFTPIFDSIGSFSKGRATVTVNGIDGWVDTEGYIGPELLDKLCESGLQAEQNNDKLGARNIYRRILSIDPDHVMALNNMALTDIDFKDYNEGISKLKKAHELAPDNKLIADNLEMAKHDRKERRWNRLNTTLSAVVAAVGIAGAGYAIGTGGTEGLQAAHSIMKSTDETIAVINGEEPTKTVGELDMPETDFPTLDMSGTTTDSAPTVSKGSGMSEQYYRDMYSRWERNAQSAYNSLTAAGVKVKKKKNGTETDEGGSALGSWGQANFNGMKQEMRQAQNEMRKIRQEARKAGYNIPQSQYENINVSF